MKFWCIFLLIFTLSTGYSLLDDLGFFIYNSSYIYNGENASYWNETRYTLTYLENLLQPYVVIKNGGVIFKLGIGFLLPFNQEDKIKNYYPYFQICLSNERSKFIMGSLENDHDFPPCILDPLIKITPKVRVIRQDRIPIDYEVFPDGIFTHGFYEYGLQVKYSCEKLFFESYINWQLPDTEFHRERFDVGLIFKFCSFYTGLHYWHNGGHEHFHPVEVTENYVSAIGYKSEFISLLYLASYFLPDRDRFPEKNVFGQGVLLEGKFELVGIIFEPNLFISSSFIRKEEKFVSIEGDPFYGVPLYAGLNISKLWKINEAEIKLEFINGTFLPDVDSEWSPMMIRYDQKIMVTFDWRLN